MVRKFLMFASLGSLLLLGLSVRAHTTPTQGGSTSGNQAQSATKSVTGKVASIGSGGHSFTLQLNSGSKGTMDFVVDKNTQVQGQVKEGTDVTVEYQAMEGGQNLAVNITARA